MQHSTVIITYVQLLLTHSHAPLSVHTCDTIDSTPSQPNHATRVGQFAVYRLLQSELTRLTDVPRLTLNRTKYQNTGAGEFGGGDKTVSARGKARRTHYSEAPPTVARTSSSLLALESTVGLIQSLGILVKGDRFAAITTTVRHDR